MPEIFTPLSPDEPIGVVALSGPTDSERLERGLAALRSWNRKVVEAPNLRARAGTTSHYRIPAVPHVRLGLNREILDIARATPAGSLNRASQTCGTSGREFCEVVPARAFRRSSDYLAGSDDCRVEGLHALLDQGVRVILAARGGYGVTRILDRLPWGRLAEAETMLVGYSDATAVLNPLTFRSGVVQVHGPVVTELTEWDGPDFVRLRALLEGRFRGARLFGLKRRDIVRPGNAVGKALGGNLSLLAALAGTPWAPDFRGAVVFLEEVNEPLYRLDRLLTQLRSSGMLSNVKALISGDLWGCEPGCDARWRQLLLEAAPEGVPVVHGLPFGHGPANLAFPVGAVVEVDTDGGTLIWRT